MANDMMGWYSQEGALALSVAVNHHAGQAAGHRRARVESSRRYGTVKRQLLSARIENELDQCMREFESQFARV